MDLEKLIQTYGVVAVFLGAAVEGETAAFLGGVFAHRHLLHYWTVAAAAALGSFSADQLYFLLGRYAGNSPTVHKMMGSPKIARVVSMLENHPRLFIFGFRFVYGIRTISPFVIGASSVKARTFVVANFLAASLWGVGITGLGYVSGGLIEMFLGTLKLHVHLLVAMAFVIPVIVTMAAILAKRMTSPRQPPR